MYPHTQPVSPTHYPVSTHPSVGRQGSTSDPVVLNSTCYRMSGPLVLTDTERRLFGMLQEAATRSGTLVRIAGGWVRDKLLGLPCDDIDVGRRRRLPPCSHS